jgi:hypothetical protein
MGFFLLGHDRGSMGATKFLHKDLSEQLFLG